MQPVTLNAPSPEPGEQKKFKLGMPHTFILLGIILIICTILTWIVPAGQYEMVEDAVTGRMVVDPDSFQIVEQSPVNPFDMIKAIQEGFIQAADIIFFIFFAYGFVYVTLASGALDAAIGALLRTLKDKVIVAIPVFMILFGVMGSTVGIYEEVYGLIPVFMGIFLALGYDAIVGGAVVVLGVGTGFAAATTNPFTIGIAQGIAEVPINSGIGFRIVCFIVFQGAAIAYTLWYANRVKKNPEKSVVFGLDYSHLAEKSQDELREIRFTGRQLACLLTFVATIGVVLYCTLNTDIGWYINEIAAAFIIGMFVIGFIAGFGPSRIASLFVEASKGIIFGAFIVGIARSILVVMESGLIIHTIVNALSSLLIGMPTYIAAVGMMMIQNIINFFIPSGSGQAAVTMPIMAPVSDIIGLSRQTAVLAYQFGDGFSNMFWPTAAATLTGIMGVPFNKWMKFMWKMFAIMVVLQVIMMIVAVAIGF